MLREIQLPVDVNLLVGLATGDDAGVYRLTESLALVQTVDFFTPVVDDPYTYGQIAAANSLSDVYAMGGKPLTAMNILCYPIRDRDPRELAEILRGGVEKITEAGAALLGGHSVEDPEPKFGLSVTGLIDPEHVATNAGAQPGDLLVLTKPIGTGIVTTAAKFDECDAATLESACRSMSTLNAGAAEAMRTLGIGAEMPIHAATDITGFGLLGHLYHLARASNVALEIDSAAVPVLPGSEALAESNVTRGGRDNGAYLAEAVSFHADLAAVRRDLLLDPQTSGGLVICVAEDAISHLLSELESQGVQTRAIVGRVLPPATKPTISVV